MGGEYKFEYSTGSHMKPSSLRIYHRDNLGDRSCILLASEARLMHSHIMMYKEGEEREKVVASLYEAHATEESESQNQTEAAL